MLESLFNYCLNCINTITLCIRQQGKCYILPIILHSSMVLKYLYIYLSHSLGDRWGTTRPGNQHSPFLSFLCSPHGILSSKLVQSRMLYSHHFLCLPLLLPPRTVPWRTVLASPEALVTCPYHFILHLFTVKKSSLKTPMAFRILLRTSSLVMWSLYERPRRRLKLLISTVSFSLSLLIMSKSHKNIKIWT